MANLVDEDTATKVEVVSEYALGSDEDAPMTLAVTSKVFRRLPCTDERGRLLPE